TSCQERSLASASLHPKFSPGGHQNLAFPAEILDARATTPSASGRATPSRSAARTGASLDPPVAKGYHPRPPSNLLGQGGPGVVPGARDEERCRNLGQRGHAGQHASRQSLGHRGRGPSCKPSALTVYIPSPYIRSSYNGRSAKPGQTNQQGAPPLYRGAGP